MLFRLWGKYFGDAVETVMGCSNILKNAVGVIGIIVIMGICILPIIKLLCIMMTYYLCSAVCEPLADKKIVNLLGEVGNTFRLFLAIMISVAVMLFIGIAIIIRISGI